jgi:hypothetical protein
MRILLVGIVLLIAFPSLGTAKTALICQPGWVTKTCVGVTACAQPDWLCCPFKSGGWQWSAPPCPAASQNKENKAHTTKG